MAAPNPPRRPRTRAVHGPDPGPGPLSTPVHFSATFSFASLEAQNAAQERGPDGAYYARLGNPTVSACERHLAPLEGADRALLFASGMAATTALFLALLDAGDAVVALRECYGGTLQLLDFGRAKLGWKVTLVGAEEPETWGRALAQGAKLFHVETPTNPTVRLVDLAAASRLAHAHRTLLTVDNTFASPMLQNPLALGADLVMHSATKYLSGHSDVLAGALMGPAALMEKIWKVRKITGGGLDPLSAWHLERGVKTLPLRVEAAGRSALSLAQKLERHDAIERVNYPGLPSHPQHELAQRQMRGFGAMVSFEVRGGGEAAKSVAEALKLIRHGPSLGGAVTQVSLPAFTSHIQLTPEERRRAGIGEGMVRLSVGLEDPEDLWVDLQQALARVGQKVG